MELRVGQHNTLSLGDLFYKMGTITLAVVRRRAVSKHFLLFFFHLLIDLNHPKLITSSDFYKIWFLPFINDRVCRDYLFMLTFL